MYKGSDQNHPKEIENKKAKWLSEEDLQIAEERREGKKQGRERELRWRRNRMGRPLSPPQIH